MITVSYTPQMEKWLKSLKDKTAAAKIKVEFVVCKKVILVTLNL